jgi:hypothetical protein
MQTEELFATVFVLGMFSGVFIIFMGLRQRSQQMEMRHRERMAMIERGQIPRDETRQAVSMMRLAQTADRPSSRSLSFGIIVAGLGLALMTIIGIAGDSPEIGVGIGGAVVILGAAFIVRSLVIRPAAVPSATPPAPDQHLDEPL